MPIWLKDTVLFAKHLSSGDAIDMAREYIFSMGFSPAHVKIVHAKNSGMIFVVAKVDIDYETDGSDNPKSGTSDGDQAKGYSVSQ